MKKEKNINIDNAHHIGAHIGNMLSKNVQDGTDATILGMELFKQKGEKLAKVKYEIGKGNLFEFIESAKLTKNMANAGVTPFDSFPVTDVPINMGGFGEHTSPDDFRLVKNGQVIGRGQAKVNNNPHKAAQNFTNPKYYGMQKNTTIDSVEEIKSHLDNMLNKGEISKDSYYDAYNNLTAMLTDPDSGITSGGTKMEELKQFCGEDGKISVNAVRNYARRFEINQYGKEFVNTSGNMAASSAIVAGVVSGVQNAFDVLNSKKELEQAIKEIGVEVVEGGIRGGLTGGLSSVIRIGATKSGNIILSDSSCATVMAASVIDGGVAIYEYSKGEIDSKQLVEQLEDTTIKSVTTIYFSKAATCVFGATNPFIPIAVYSVANYVVANTRAIIKNAKLNADEYERLAKLNDEMTITVKKLHKELISQMEEYRDEQKIIMKEFLETFEQNILSENSCDKAIYAIISFANQTGIALQHTDFDDFSKSMISDSTFVLK